MNNIQDAKKLAKEMIEIGKLAHRETVCVITNMNEPLGHAVGNTLEVKEAIEFLKGNMPEDLKSVVLELGAYMMQVAGKGNNIEENKKVLLENIINRKAYEKFIELVGNQQGDISYIQHPEKFKKANFIEAVYCNCTGYIHEIHAKEIGEIACMLGAGRLKKEDEIDNDVGIILQHKVGDVIEKGDILAYIHANDKTKLKSAKEKIIRSIQIDTRMIEKQNTILDVMY